MKFSRQEIEMLQMAVAIITDTRDLTDENKEKWDMLWDKLGRVHTQEASLDADKTRPAKDLNGAEITWHLFYINQYQQPMALVEYSGTMKIVPATWVEFTDTKNPVT